MGEQATATEGACCVLLGCVAWWCWCTGLQDPPAARAHGRDANEERMRGCTLHRESRVRGVEAVILRHLSSTPGAAGRLGVAAFGSAPLDS